MLKESQRSQADTPPAGEGAIIYEIPDRAPDDDLDERDVELERLRERVATLETWLEVAARRRCVEYMQAQRLAMLNALERDDRYRFVLRLPVALSLLYAAVLGVVVFALLGGRW
jgi:hypothetical protein